MSGALHTPGALAVLLWRTLRAVGREGLPVRDSLRELNELGGRSAALVLGGMAFFGAVLVTIAHAQARRFIGNVAVIGPPYLELLVREMGPILSAVLTAARAGASHAAELSTQRVTEQVDALEMSAGDPARDLVAPRVVAGVLGVPLLCVLGTLAAAVSAALTAQYGYGVDGRAFLDARFVDGTDVVAGAVKALACGLYIPLAAARAGLAARGGAEAVGEATTRGVVSACVGCLVIAFLVGIAFHGVGA